MKDSKFENCFVYFFQIYPSLCPWGFFRYMTWRWWWLCSRSGCASSCLQGFLHRLAPHLFHLQLAVWFGQHCKLPRENRSCYGNPLSVEICMLEHR